MFCSTFNSPGDVGGQLGLMLGASVLTLVEFLDLFLFTLYHQFLRLSRKKKKKEEEEDEASEANNNNDEKSSSKLLKNGKWWWWWRFIEQMWQCGKTTWKNQCRVCSRELKKKDRQMHLQNADTKDFYRILFASWRFLNIKSLKKTVSNHGCLWHGQLIQLSQKCFDRYVFMKDIFPFKNAVLCK